MKSLYSLICGTLFGFGLALSGMINPAKVLAFLDIFGNWDPSLLLVMGGALLVTGGAYPFILRRPAPVKGVHFQLPGKTELDRPLVVGAVLFGVGWGVIGLCPGPAVASLAYGRPESLIFLAAMVAAMGLGRRLTA